MTKQLTDHFEFFKETNTAAFLSIIAFVAAFPNVKIDSADLVAKYSRGDYKRAIRVLRVIQQANPQYSEDIESAVALIRREWLHREDR